MFDTLAKNTLVPLVLRLGLAVIFVYHGIEKVGKEGGLGWHKELAGPLQFAVAWGELLGGIALGLGFLTRFAALGIALIMGGAIVTVHGSKGFSLEDGGFEYNFAILVICAAVFLLGGGSLAVDRWFKIRRKK
jgi:putative oxidoreductase